MAYFSGAYTVFSVVYAVTASGLTGASAKLVSAYDAGGRRGDIRTLQSVSFWLYGGIGLCGGLVTLLGARQFAIGIDALRQRPQLPSLLLPYCSVV